MNTFWKTVSKMTDDNKIERKRETRSQQRGKRRKA